MPGRRNHHSQALLEPAAPHGQAHHQVDLGTEVIGHPDDVHPLRGHLRCQGAADGGDPIQQRGGKILREAGPMNSGTTIIAFVADPDGYPIELIGKRA